MTAEILSEAPGALSILGTLFMDANKLRAVLLEVVNQHGNGPMLQTDVVLNAALQRLKIPLDLEGQQMLLTFWGDLFRSGYLAWGYDLNNTKPPFCHITTTGRRLLANFSRDPANPDGYLNHLATRTTLNPVAASYLKEGLATFNAGLFKSAAVMVGAASESLVLAVRDCLITKMENLNQAVPKKLADWRIKTVLDALEETLTQKRLQMPPKLRESFGSYWPAFTQQIRAVRNEAGHPASVDPIEESAAHAALLMFPYVAHMASDLENWINTTYT